MEYLITFIVGCAVGALGFFLYILASIRDVR